MIKLLKKSASAFLLSGAFLFVPHMGECALQDGTYISEARDSDGTARTQVEIKGTAVRGHFHKRGDKILFDGTLNHDSADVTHHCNVECKDGVAKQQNRIFDTRRRGNRWNNHLD